MCGRSYGANSAWGPGLHHVLGARRGLPTTDVLAAWVIAPDALTADGLATALFLGPTEVLPPHFSFAAVRMLANQPVEVTASFPAKFLFNILPDCLLWFNPCFPPSGAA